MRFEQRISVCLKFAVACGAAAVLSGSERTLFASGQATQPAAPTQTAKPPVPAQPQSGLVVPGPELQLSADEAVKLALENNLGIRAERLSPQAQAFAVAQTRAAYAPIVFGGSTKNSNSSPPQNFLAGNDFTTNAGFRSTAGVAQNLKWFGGRYQASLDGARNTTSDPTDPFNPRLSSNFNFNFTQPLLRDFTIDQTRQQLLIGEKQQEIVDLQLQQQVTQTSRSVRNAYYDLVSAIGQLRVSQESLQLAQESLKNNERRFEVGTIPEIDIVESQAEVSRNQESVIISESQVKSFEDALRTLILNPQQPDFWAVHIVPSEEPVLTPRALDLDAAIQSALNQRTDIAQTHREMDQTDITMKFARNQKLPALNAIVNYGLAGVGGTRTIYDTSGGFPVPTGVAQRSFSDALRDIFGNDFKTWSVQLNVSYPIGTSIADAAYAQTKLQKTQEAETLHNLEMGVTTQVRQAARDVNTNLRRIEAARRARELAEQRLAADNKRFNVGLANTFEVLQSQRDLSRARNAELRAVIDYNQSLVDFEAVQIAPIR